MSFQTGPIIGAFNCEVPWTLAEETMLLDAVEQYGFGNWYLYFNLCWRAMSPVCSRECLSANVIEIT